MRITLFAASLVLPLSALSLIGCAGKSFSTTPSGPGVPAISSLTPTVAATGGPAFSLVVNGSNFTPAAQVLWNGSARSTSVQTSGAVTAQITAADISAAGTEAITVSDVGGTSAASTFTVMTSNNPAPTVSALSPATAMATGPAFSLTITGTNFVAASTVLWNGSARPTTVASSTSLTAQISAADIAAQGNATVTVSNPPPGGGTSSGSTFTITAPPNPLPSVTAIAPSSVTAAGPAFALTVTGSNFISTSQVQWNGAARTTTVNSATSLTAQITAADIATAGSATIAVSNPAPGGGRSGSLTLTIAPPNNPTPTIAAIAPNAANAGSAAFALTVTGTNFVANSQVLWNGAARVTTFTSASSLTAQVTAADVASVGTATVSVSTPAPGGGVSAGLTFSINQPGNPVPAISSLSPTGANVGGQAFVLTVMGSNFVSGSQVQWNGSARTTTYVSATLLNAQITAADIAAVGNNSVTVVTPTPGGGTSGAAMFAVSTNGNPVPTLSSLTPDSTVVSTTPIQINLNGTNFLPGSVAHVGAGYSTAVTTNFVNSTLLQITIPVTLLSSAGVQPIYVTNPYPGGGTTSSLNFTIQPSSTQSFTVQTIKLTANDIVWDGKNQKLYVTVPGKSGANGNSVIAIDPVTLAVGGAIFAGSEPTNLAIADDSSVLYVALTGSDSIQRFQLPGLTTDINFTLGQSTYNNQPYGPLDIAVAPGSAHELAVLRTTVNYGNGSVAIYDDTTLRAKTGLSSYYSYGPARSAMLWGSDATKLYVGSQPSYYITALTIGSDGVDASVNYQPTGYNGIGSGMHFDRGTGYLYDNSGHVVNPNTGQPVGVFNAFGYNASGAMVPDSTLGTAYFVGQSSTGFQSSFVLQTFDINHFTATGSITLNNITGTPLRLIRWGTNGLALITASGTDSFGQPTGGQIYLISGSFVNPHAVVGIERSFEAGTAVVKDTWSAKPAGGGGSPQQ